MLYSPETAKTLAQESRSFSAIFGLLVQLFAITRINASCMKPMLYIKHIVQDMFYTKS